MAEPHGGRHGESLGTGLCGRKHYCSACRWGGCALGEVCEDIHIGEDCTPTAQPGCGLSVACDCEPCLIAAGAPAGVQA